jgi:hypothetical protein
MRGSRQDLGGRLSTYFYQEPNRMYFKRFVVD